MKLVDHLSKEQIQQLNKLKSQSPKNKDNNRTNKDKKKPEKVNWKDIMGVYRDTYERRNGAMRRK